MNTTLTLAAAVALFAVPALAQPAPRHAGAMRHPHSRAHPVPARAGATGGAPLDRGPFTAEANRAYQGGGVILQGAPGAPAPTPAPTPPGQAPLNSVPVR